MPPRILVLSPLFMATLSMVSPCAFAQWEKSVDRSEMDGITTLILSAPVMGPKKPSSRYRALMIRCSAKRTEVIFHSGGVMESDTAGDIQTRLKFDDDAPSAAVGSRSTDYSAVFFNRPSALLASLLRAKRVLIEYTPFHSGPIVVTVNVADLAKHRADILKHCDSPTETPPPAKEDR